MFFSVTPLCGNDVFRSDVSGFKLTQITAKSSSL